MEPTTSFSSRLTKLNEKWKSNPDGMTDQEKALHYQQFKLYLHCKIETLSEPPGAAAMDEAATLKLSGQLLRDVTSGASLFPTREELNDAFALRCSQEMHPVEIRVEGIHIENNFNFVHLDPSSNNHLLQINEAYVTFGSAIQAEYVRSLGQPTVTRITHAATQKQHIVSLYFERPARSRAVRATYAQIGALIQRLRSVDSRLRALGAVAQGGMPVLPERYVQKEKFDARANEYMLRDDRRGLHDLLVHTVRIDRDKRQAALDALVEERIGVLLRLSEYDPDEFPFAVEREFK